MQDRLLGGLEPSAFRFGLAVLYASARGPLPFPVAATAAAPNRPVGNRHARSSFTSGNGTPGSTGILHNPPSNPRPLDTPR